MKHFCFSLTLFLILASIALAEETYHSEMRKAIVVSGHGKPVAMSQLRALYDKTEALYTFVQNQLQQGKNFDESKSAAEKSGYPADWIEFYFKNLSKKKTEETKKK